MADEEPKADEISEANSEVFGKLRDLAKDLEAVVEHENRVLEEEPPGKEPGASARPYVPSIPISRGATIF